MPHVALYLRVSTRRQDTRSQEPDLERWAEAYAKDQQLCWYRDQASGRTMDRPGWRQLEAQLELNQVSQLVVWRLDRLGRTASGLTSLIEKLTERKIGFVSLKDGLDLRTPAGRLIANVLASVAAYENEVRAERIIAGQAAARAAGKTWGGSIKGRRLGLSPEQVATIARLHAEGGTIAAIARATGTSRPSVYRVIKR